MRERWQRTARGWTIAVLSAVATALLHVSAGGAFGSPALVLLALLIAGLAATGLAGRRLGPLRLTAAVGTSQLVFHATFALGSAPVHLDASAHAGHAPLAHAHLAAPAELAAAAAAPAEGWSMAAAHLLAGGLTALLILQGERALRALRRAAARLLPRPDVAAASVAPHRRVATPAPQPRRIRGVVALDAASLRGPPRLPRAA